MEINNSMSLTDNPLSNTYEFDLEVEKGMSLNMTFNGNWENRVIVRNITCCKEIGRISGKLGTEGTLTYDNPHECPVKIQCVFEHRKPDSVKWENDKYRIMEDHSTFKKVGCEDGFDRNFTDIVMFVCITQKEKSCMSNESRPPISSECQRHLAGIVKVSTEVIGKPELDVEDSEYIKIILENPCKLGLTIEGITLSKAIYRTKKDEEHVEEHVLDIITPSTDSVEADYPKPTLAIFYHERDQQVDAAKIKVDFQPQDTTKEVLVGSRIFTRLIPSGLTFEEKMTERKKGGRLLLFYQLGSVTFTDITTDEDQNNRIKVSGE
jgi:hypothetical protein